jgi:DNA helicase-2/ATP-dependent DNA helicase PcrA
MWTCRDCDRLPRWTAALRGNDAAQDQLHLMAPQRFFTHGQRSLGDRHVYAQRTRFIPNGLTKHFQSRYWPQSKASDGVARPSRTPIDVQASMRRMWGAR